MSGKIPAAIHISPEAFDGGMLAKLSNGDLMLVDGVNGWLDVLIEGIAERVAQTVDLDANQVGTGRELFAHFRRAVGSADAGASVFG